MAEEDVGRSLSGVGENWVYWERTNPMGFKILIAIIVAVVLGVSFSIEVWFLPFTLLVLVPCIGGFELFITPKRLAVRLGYLRIPMFTIPVKEIATVDILEFAQPQIGIGYSKYHSMWGSGWRFVVGRRVLELKADRNQRILISSVNCEEVKKLIDSVKTLKHD